MQRARRAHEVGDVALRRLGVCGLHKTRKRQTNAHECTNAPSPAAAWNESNNRVIRREARDKQMRDEEREAANPCEREAERTTGKSAWHYV